MRQMPWTNTLFQGNFNFSGAITTLSIEVSGRDVNLVLDHYLMMLQ